MKSSDLCAKLKLQELKCVYNETNHREFVMLQYNSHLLRHQCSVRTHLAPVVQRLDNAIHRINRISDNKTNHAIRWIVIYPVDSVIQPLNNRGLKSKNNSYKIKNSPRSAEWSSLPASIKKMCWSREFKEIKSFNEKFGLDSQNYVSAR